MFTDTELQLIEGYVLTDTYPNYLAIRFNDSETLQIFFLKEFAIIENNGTFLLSFPNSPCYTINLTDNTKTLTQINFTEQNLNISTFKAVASNVHPLLFNPVAKYKMDPIINVPEITVPEPTINYTTDYTQALNNYMPRETMLVTPVLLGIIVALICINKFIKR